MLSQEGQQIDLVPLCQRQFDIDANLAEPRTPPFWLALVAVQSPPPEPSVPRFAGILVRDVLKG